MVQLLHLYTLFPSLTFVSLCAQYPFWCAYTMCVCYMAVDWYSGICVCTLQLGNTDCTHTLCILKALAIVVVFSSFCLRMSQHIPCWDRALHWPLLVDGFSDMCMYNVHCVFMIKYWCVHTCTCNCAMCMKMVSCKPLHVCVWNTSMLLAGTEHHQHLFAPQTYNSSLPCPGDCI